MRRDGNGMRRFATMAVVVLIAVIAAVPAAASGHLPAKSQVADFYTAALDADGQFKMVHCTEAKMGVKADVIKESYKCMFLDDSFLGPPALPAEGMTWDYASSTALHDDFFNIDGPYRWFSDVEDIVSGFDLCWLYSTDWTMKIDSSGKVNVKVLYYAPFVWEGPDC
jgi:hypothetical protein